MKKIWILLICLVLTGCNVKYTINIDDDLKITESSRIVGSDELYRAYYKTSRNNVLSNLLDIYSTSLLQNHYEYELVKGENPYVNLKKTYNNIGDYLDDSKLFNDYFDKIDYQRNGNIIKIETFDFNPNVIDNPDRFFVNNLDIIIQLPFKVIKHNASEVNEKTNTYRFTMNEETNDFKILLEFDSSKKFNPHMKTIVMVLASLVLIVAIWIYIYYLNRRKKV